MGHGARPPARRAAWGLSAVARSKLGCSVPHGIIYRIRQLAEQLDKLPIHLRFGRRTGQALVEFAFVLVWGLLALFVLIDAGRFFFEYNAMRGGLLMASVQMQNSEAYSGLSACDTSVWPPADRTTDDRCDRVRRIAVDASGLSAASTTDLYGADLPSGEREQITFTADSGSLFAACGEYTIRWRRPFLPLAPYARQLFGLTGNALVLIAEVKGQHNNNPAGTACT